MAGAKLPLAKLRRICLALPEAYEERAWVGTRWRIRSHTFAHVLRVVGGKPAAYARASGRDTATVLTVRTAPELHDAIVESSPRCFDAPWGTKWNEHVVGIVLDPRATKAPVDWPRVAWLIAESYCLLAPAKLVARVPR